jgi:EmrB/QacA subfamily drug resistance transporter
MRDALRDPAYVHHRRWVILPVLCLSLVVIVLDNTIVNVALPSLARADGLGATQSQLQWIVDAYVVVFAGLLLSAGSIGDRFGRYRFLTAGLVVFGISSVLSAWAGDADVLIATRILMGIGAALIMPSTLSILTNVFLDPAERGKAIGIWAGISALGVGVGPVFGGFLLEHFWWGSIFLVNVPLVVLALGLGYLLLPESRDPAAPRLDLLGATLSITALVALLWAMIEAPSRGWTSGSVLAADAAGVVLLVTFLLWERRSPHPMLHLRFFENPRFSAASAAIAIAYFGLFGMIFLLTQYLQSVLGLSTVKAGAALLPQAAAIMVAAPLSATFTRRFGNKAVVATGLALVAVAYACFLLLDEHSSLLAVFGVTLLIGLAMGNVLPPSTDSIMGSLPRAKAGVGSAMNDTSRQMGGAIGVAVLGSLLSSRYAHHVAAALPRGVPGRTAAMDSIGHALAAAQSAPRGASAAIEAAARSGFVSGMHVAALVSVGVLAVGVLVVLRWLPSRERPAPTTPSAAEFDTRMLAAVDAAREATSRD